MGKEYARMIFTAPTVPGIPVGKYGDELLSLLSQNVGTILPYLAAITVFVIGVALVMRWVGFKNFMEYGDKYDALKEGPSGYYEGTPYYQGKSGKIYTSKDYE